MNAQALPQVCAHPDAPAASAAETGSESGGLPRLSATDAGPVARSLCFATASSVADFRAVYDAGFKHVWHTLRRLGVVERDLEDAAHEVFVVVHRRLAEFDATRPLKPWLTGIAWRVAADERRRARHRRESLGEAPASTQTPGPGPEQALASEQARARVHRALQSLDLDRRVVFVMAELDGASAPEIAQALGIPLNTVYSRLRVARQRLADAVRRQGDER
jgi:RNA polymerase sigma-70 factor (ECF subfamily)